MCEDAKKERIRLIVIDGHIIVRQGLELSLNAFEDMQIVARAECGDKALQLCRELRPDVILIGWVKPEIGNVATVRQMASTCPHARIIALTSSDNGRDAQEALRAGATICLPKNVTVERLTGAIRENRPGT